MRNLWVVLSCMLCIALAPALLSTGSNPYSVATVMFCFFFSAVVFATIELQDFPLFFDVLVMPATAFFLGLPIMKYVLTGTFWFSDLHDVAFSLGLGVEASVMQLLNNALTAGGLHHHHHHAHCPNLEPLTEQCPCEPRLFVPRQSLHSTPLFFRRAVTILVVTKMKLKWGLHHGGTITPWGSLNAARIAGSHYSVNELFDHTRVWVLIGAWHTILIAATVAVFLYNTYGSA